MARRSQNNIKKEVEVPKNFIQKKKGLNKPKYGTFDGRKYKILKNGFGMWADTGKLFYLSDLEDN